MTTKSQRSKSKDRRHSQHKHKGGKFDNEDDFFNNIMDINIKKPGTAYNYYIKEMNEKGNYSNITEASRENAAKWSKLSSKDKEKYEKIVDEETERYNEHMALCKKYLIDVDVLQNKASAYSMFKRYYVDNAVNKEGRSAQEARDHAKKAWYSLSDSDTKKWEDAFEKHRSLQEDLKKFSPGNVNAYSMFIADRVSNDGKDFKEAAKEWKNLSEKKRETYEKLAEEENKEKKKLITLWEITNGVKPKRPVGALQLYMKKLSEDRELEGITDVLVETAKRWKKLSDDEKAHYERIHKQNQLEYQIKFIEYKKHISKKFGKAPSAMNLYVSEMSSKYRDEDMQTGELFKILSEKWKKEKDSVKASYEKKAKEIKEEMDNYKEKILDTDRPKKNYNAYTIYFKEVYPAMKKKHSNLSANELMSEIAKNWQALDSSDKRPYAKKADKEKERYEEEIKEWEKEHGVRGRTQGTQRYVEDGRIKSKGKSGYEKYLDSQRREAESRKRSQSQSRKSSKSSKKDAKSNKKSKSKKDDKSSNKSKDKASKSRKSDSRSKSRSKKQKK